MDISHPVSTLRICSIEKKKHKRLDLAQIVLGMHGLYICDTIFWIVIPFSSILLLRYILFLHRRLKVRIGRWERKRRKSLHALDCFFYWNFQYFYFHFGSLFESNSGFSIFYLHLHLGFYLSLLFIFFLFFISIIFLQCNNTIIERIYQVSIFRSLFVSLFIFTFRLNLSSEIPDWIKIDSQRKTSEEKKIRK